MAAPSKLTRQDLVAAAASRFRHAYKAWWNNDRRPPSFLMGRTCKEVHEDLKQATTIEAVDALLGPSWTRLECNNCQRGVEAVAQLDSQAQAEYGSCNYCADCLRAALAAVEGA